MSRNSRHKFVLKYQNIQCHDVENVWQVPTCPACFIEFLTGPDLTGIISNIDHSCKGYDLGWVIWCIQHQEVNRYFNLNPYAAEPVTDTHDNIL